MICFKILFYLFSVAFVVSGIYTCIKAKKEREDKAILIVAAIFHFALATLAFYVAHWGIIVTF